MAWPQTSSYDRLEGGLGSNRMGPSFRNFAWKRLAVGVAVIFGLVWVLSPSEQRDAIWGGIKRPGACRCLILL